MLRALSVVAVLTLAWPAPLLAARRAAVRIPVPGTRQATEYTCGTATAISVLQRHGLGDDLTEKQHALRMGTNYKTGTEPVEIARYLRGYGVSARLQNRMTIAGLRRALDAEQPVFVLLQAWAKNPATDYQRTNANGHWVLAIGYDKERIHFMDPWIGGARGTLANADLESRWHSVDRAKRPRYQHLGIVVDTDLPVVNRATYARSIPIE